MEGILRTLRFTPLFYKQKKSTDDNPCGLPSVALAKDGGADEGGKAFLSHLKTTVFSLFHIQVQHFTAHHHLNPAIAPMGKKRGISHLSGKIWGKSLFANQPVSKRDSNPRP